MAALGLLYTMAAMGGLGIPRRAYLLPLTDLTYAVVLLLFAAKTGPRAGSIPDTASQAKDSETHSGKGCRLE
jgi:hypothetical protein